MTTHTQSKPIPPTTRLYDIHPPRFLSGAELAKPVTVVIERAQWEDVRTADGEIESRPVLYVKGGKRGLVFTKTLGKCFAEIAGIEPHELTFAQIVGLRCELHQCRTRNKRNWMICARAAAPNTPNTPNTPGKTVTRPAEQADSQTEAEHLTTSP